MQRVTVEDEDEDDHASLGRPSIQISTQSQPHTAPRAVVDDSDELDYVENPFEERR